MTHTQRLQRLLEAHHLELFDSADLDRRSNKGATGADVRNRAVFVDGEHDVEVAHLTFATVLERVSVRA